MSQYALSTIYAEKMDRSLPWNEYPRPSMKRDSFLCLNGTWDLAVTSGEFSGYDLKILVPFPPESALSGLDRSISDGEVMYYRRSFTLPSDFIRDRVILHFGAVDTICVVRVNGRIAIRHEGGYLPFCADITDLLTDGENELTVEARDSLNLIYPYGKQTNSRGGMWYTAVSGIWQTVWLESVPMNYIERVKVTPTLSNALIEVTGGAREKRLTLKNTGESFFFSSESFTVTPSEIHLWSPENPYLYEYVLESGDDRIEGYFALREISIGGDGNIPKLCLNGEPYFFNGLLDQGYFPDGIFLPATSEGYRDDILLAKKLGFNMLRKHIKIEPEIFYYLCDTLGIAVFQDMVNNSDYSFFRDTALPTVGFKHMSDRNLHNNPVSRRIFKEMMHATLDHLHNFPSIVYYTIFNEGWGQFCADDVYIEARSHDPSRIYDATSGWFVQKDSDVDSRHIYFKPIKIKKRSRRPVVISEFGGYSHRVTEHLFGDKNYGYSSYAEREAFEEAFIKLYSDQLEPVIPRGVCAAVYTQLSDVEDETNGLVTYDRRVVKVDVERVRALMDRLKGLV